MISVIIVHWNTPDDLHSQLRGLIAHNTQPIEIIVIDNNSSESIDWVTQECPGTQLVQNERNRGFAYACNQGVLRAKGEWLLFLNPDVSMTPELIGRMIDQAQKNNLEACSPRPASDHYRKPVPSWQSLLGEFSPLGRFLPAQTTSTPTLTGGCLLIKSEVLQKIGGWDERFFLWFEDSDLTKRLGDEHIAHGFVDVDVSHTGGRSFAALADQQKKDLFFHAMDIYARKHFGPFGRLVVRIIKRRYTQANVLPPLNGGVSITVPNLKKDLLKSFLQNNSSTFDSIQELIIVTSAVASAEFFHWKKLYPDIRWILLKNNNGYAPTVNVGLRASTGQWMGTVNDDVSMTDDWIQKTLECAGPKTGAANPVIYTDEKTIESAGISVLKKGKAVPVTVFDGEQCILTDACNAAGVLYRNEALNAVGLFDERFGSYLEDIDLSLRMRRAGWEQIVSLKAQVFHAGHATSKEHLNRKKTWHDARNWIYVIGKNWTPADLVKNLLPIFTERLRNISGIIKTLGK